MLEPMFEIHHYLDLRMKVLLLYRSAPKAQCDFRPGQRPGEQYLNHLNALQGQLETSAFYSPSNSPCPCGALKLFLF
jgi:hypothetical protein